MPRTWSDKDERQYEHIKQTEEERGEPRAKEIAARTVNKQRSREGRTRAELYDQAKKLGVKGRSKMTKQQLEAAIRKSH